nr:MAG: glycoprotein [Culex Bunyavirus 2]
MGRVLIFRALVFSLSWMVSSGDCGVYMHKGLLTSNCTGLFTLRINQNLRLVQCTHDLEEKLHEPVEVFKGDCKDILLDYEPLTTKTNEMYHLVLIPTLIVSILLMMGLSCCLAFRSKYGVEKGESISITRQHILVCGDTSIRKFKWSAVLLTIILCRETTSICLPAKHSHTGKTMNQYTFDLDEGSSACFDLGIVTHVENSEVLEIFHLYNTTTWREYVWSAKACGYGNCGSEKECSYYGEIGRVVENVEKGLIYKKFCHPHDRAGIFCIWKWGCWLATNEVMFDRKLAYSVYQVGSSTTNDEYTVEGLDNCTISQENLDPVISVDYKLVVSPENKSWLCDQVSPPGRPSAGLIGDLHWMGDIMHFDYNAFQCDIGHSSSSGSCRVAKPSIPNMLSNCLELPTMTPIGFLSYSSGELKARSSSARRFSIRCPSSIKPNEVSHKCHSIEASLHGIRSEGRSSYLSIAARSINSSSVLVINSTCGDDPIIVACNSQPHLFKLTNLNYAKCYPDLGSVQNKMRDHVEEQWVWESADHGATITNTHLTVSLSTIGVILVILILILLLRK